VLRVEGFFEIEARADGFFLFVPEDDCVFPPWEAGLAIARSGELPAVCAKTCAAHTNATNTAAKKRKLRECPTTLA